MRIKYRFGYNSGKTQISAFLDKQAIKYVNSGLINIFEIYDNHENFDFIKNSMKLFGVVANPPEAEYSKDEIDKAEWLSVRSTWRNGYPQPQDKMNYRFTTYDSANYCNQCYYGLVQKDSFVLKKEPNWGTRNFLMLNWIQDELFISKKAKDILITSDLKGFDIYDVFTKSRNTMEGIKQIFVRNYLNNGLMSESVEDELRCSKCNRIIFITKPVIYYDSKVFNDIDSDIIKTQEKFGQLTCCSFILMTHKFYKAITSAKLDRGLVFEPIQLT